jgi:putative transposase
METTMTLPQCNDLDAVMELLIQQGPDAMAEVFRRLLNMAMRFERDQFLGAGPYERSNQRVGYANGYKPKRQDTPAGTVTLDVPKTRGGEEPFFPQALQRGARSTRAVMATIAQMYVQGVSTRDVKNVMRELGIQDISSSQVSRANAMLDAELSAWRERTLGEVRYLVLDARYEKARTAGVVIDTAVLSAVGIGADGLRRVLGTSVALSEAEVHWRAFLESLVKRGMTGVRFIASDDHAGLKAARKAVLPSVPWQRCQFHLAQNAVHHCPTVAIRSEIGDWLRSIFNAKDLSDAQQALVNTVKHFQSKAPQLADWLEHNVPESLTVFALPPAHRRKLRTTNGIERPIQQELKRRTRSVRVFPNPDSLLRLASAILIEIDEKWATADNRYITWEDKVTA